MIELLKRLLDIIANPVLVAVIVSFVMTVLILWRLFEKQHDFIKERVELLRQENEDLRRQIHIFREENERLRNASSMIVNAVDELRAQPLLGQKQLEELHEISEAARKAVEQSLPATREVIENSFRLILAVKHIAETNEQSLIIQSEGFNNLQRAIAERASDQEILKIIQRLIHLFGESQRGIGPSIQDLEKQARDLLSRRS